MKKIALIVRNAAFLAFLLLFTGCTPQITKIAISDPVIKEEDLVPRSINAGKAPYERITIPAVSELTLPNVIADYMIFEADKPIIFWGLSPKKEDVTIRIYDKDVRLIREKTIRPAEDTSFMTEIKGIGASFDEYSLEISTASRTEKVKGVLFGRLYLAGGQSNMDMVLSDIYQKEEVFAEAVNSHIRVFNLAINPCSEAEYSPYPVFNAPIGGRWVKGDNQLLLKNVTAVGYLFAKGMYEKLNTGGTDMPVGIISTSRGGTRIDTWMSRGAIEADPSLKAEMKKEKVLADENNWITENGGPDFIFNQSTALYNMKIAPVTNMNISGLLWYQGETNVGRSMALFARELDAFVKDLSVKFRYEPYKLPVVLINIAPYEYHKIYWDKKLITGAAEVNEIFNDFAAQHNANVVSTPIYDVSLRFQDAVQKNSIHPTDKIPVAARAVELFYGMTHNVFAPSYSGFTVSGSKLILEFSNTADGLMTSGNEPLAGFRICGEDRKFYIADAAIVGKNTVELTSKDVLQPVAASYAFENMNQDSNLYNSAGMLVPLFRTDRAEYIFVAETDD